MYETASSAVLSIFLRNASWCFHVALTGALTASKGPQNVVEATLEYADIAPTIFIGDGELREQIEVSLNDRGRLLGFVSAEDKAALINAASVLAAAPEKKEHFGIIYAEGLAAGTPPVAYEGGGVSSIITPETGIVTKRDPKSLGCAIRALLTDPKKLAEMASEGRTRAEENFSWLTLGQRLEDWLLGIISSGHDTNGRTT
jgi:glycosyltransferase involved in cell wall biosynthesis